MERCFLILNTGSSSIKFQVIGDDSKLTTKAQGRLVNLPEQPVFIAEHGPEYTEHPLPASTRHDEGLLYVINWIFARFESGAIKAFVHRVVHGGTRYTESVVVTPEVLDTLSTYIPLAPLHQNHNLGAIRWLMQHHPNIPNIACFDTAFHAKHSRLFTEYALPKSLRDQGIRRYGFHGLSFEWIARQLQEFHPDLAQGRVVIAHLGNGASLCALNRGQSIDTTMGLTALDGLPMGTRCGSLDPGAITYMIRELNLDVATVEDLLYNQSGLLGLSGLTNDVKTIEATNTEDCRFALDYFCLKTAQHIGMMCVALGGIDAIIFTGGIGEHSQQIRQKILKHTDCLHPGRDLVIPTNEERMMALHAQKRLGSE